MLGKFFGGCMNGWLNNWMIGSPSLHISLRRVFGQSLHQNHSVALLTD